MIHSVEIGRDRDPLSRRETANENLLSYRVLRCLIAVVFAAFTARRRKTFAIAAYFFAVSWSAFILARSSKRLAISRC